MLHLDFHSELYCHLDFLGHQIHLPQLLFVQVGLLPAIQQQATVIVSFSSKGVKQKQGNRVFALCRVIWTVDMLTLTFTGLRRGPGLIVLLAWARS